jgi:hypothetical protein
MPKKKMPGEKYNPIRTARDNIKAMYTLGKYAVDYHNPGSARNRAKALAGDAQAYRRAQRGGQVGGISKRAASYAARLKRGK